MAYVYANQSYDTQAEVEAAVTAFKTRLDNNPTDWVRVKLLGGNAEDGWVVPTETLNDAEINSLDANSYYSVSDVHGGTNETGLTGTEATAKVAEFRTTYARWKKANTITETYPPTNEDMSSYE
jgi:hypothetical protein